MRPLPSSVRPGAGAVGNMAGAIFMCNVGTMEQCIEIGVFGLPIEYESFIYNVKRGMHLFLFENDLRKLYGVFEATSDGGLGINRASFLRAFPAQVRVRIVRRCTPLSEDQFSPAIGENYYQPRKFYIDLSKKQVADLCDLFGVKHPKQNYMEYGSLRTQDCSKRIPDIKAGSSNDRSHFIFPQTQALANRYSSHTSNHTVLQPGVGVQPNMMMPWGIGNFGAQITSMHNQLAGSLPYPQPQYLYPHMFLPSAGYGTHNLIYGAVSTISTVYNFPVPALSLQNPQGNANYQERIEQRQVNNANYQERIEQCQLSAHDEMHASSESEQVTNSPFPQSELNLPSELDIEAEAGESTDSSEPPFVDFKRRSEARNVDKTLDVMEIDTINEQVPPFDNGSPEPEVIEVDNGSPEAEAIEVPPFDNGAPEPPEAETIEFPPFDMDISGLANMTYESRLQEIIKQTLQTLLLASTMPDE